MAVKNVTGFCCLFIEQSPFGTSRPDRVGAGMCLQQDQVATLTSLPVPLAAK
jgi:hypothetical protein